MSRRRHTPEQVRMGRGLTLVALGVAGVLMGLAACADAANPADRPTPTPTYRYIVPTLNYDPDSEREALVSAYKRWQSNKSVSYSFEAMHYCHDCGFYDDPLKVTVRNGVTESVVHMRSGMWLDRDTDYFVEPFGTIDYVFDELRDLLGHPPEAYRLFVEYHPVLGYPIDLGYNTVPPNSSDGGGLSIRNYEPIPRSEPPAPTPTPLHEALVEVAAARSLWEAKGSDDYTIEYASAIDGYSDTLDPVRLAVRNGFIHSITTLSERWCNHIYGVGQPVRRTEKCAAAHVSIDGTRVRAVQPVDGIFDLIVKALHERLFELRDDPYWQPWTSRWHVRAVYDPDLGYPMELSFTEVPHWDPAYEWLRISMRNYEPMQPSATPGPFSTPTPTPID